MEREYLEDYEQRERHEFESLLKRMKDDRFDFLKDRYPPDRRFEKLQRPVAIVEWVLSLNELWAQIPFSGSLVLPLYPYSREYYEGFFGKSGISKIIDFIKDTGRLQIVLSEVPTTYVGLDHLDPFFTELHPPVHQSVPITVMGKRKEWKNAVATFHALASVKLFDFLQETFDEYPHAKRISYADQFMDTYVTLKLGRFSIASKIENLLIDDPDLAAVLLYVAGMFIDYPLRNLRFDLFNRPLKQAKLADFLPQVHRPKELRFPCEIGVFLMSKMTYAPQGLRACYDMIDHYNNYDMQKVLQAMNEAITTNHPDVLEKSAAEFSEILDNIWEDKTIPRRIKSLEIGIPLSIAAIGGVAAGPIGAATGGFLAELGFRVVDKILDLSTQGLSERLAKLKTKSYQANVYDFKKKYKSKIVSRNGFW